MFILYNLLLTVLSPFWIPWMYFRAVRRKGTINWQERAGDYELPPRGDRRRIWVHAVSVGEVIASTPFLRALRKRLPGHEIVLSVTTSSGHEVAIDKGAGLYDHLVYFPIDLPRFQLRAMQRVRPDVVAIMETELWMNFLWAAKTFSARTLLINGRISDRSFPRAKRLSFFYRALLRDMDACLMQSETDAERIRELGAATVEVLGNCKFDQAIESIEADPDYWRQELGLTPGRPVVVVGSIRAEEFEMLSQVVADCHEPYWIIAPRHLEKTESLLKAIHGAKISGSVVRRSQGNPGDVILLDTYGELVSVYSVADVVIVGGGFAKLGGQNILQPLAQGKPVLFGAHMQNFRDVAAMTVAAGAGIVCPDSAELLEETRKLINDPASRRAMSVAAVKLVKENIGAGRRYADAVAAELLRADQVTGPSGNRRPAP